MSDRHAQLDALAMGLMLLFCAIWGINQVAAKVADASFSPLLQGGMRSVGASVLLGIWCLARGVPLMARDGSLWPGLLAGLLFSAEFGAFYWGLHFTAASRGVLFLYTAPFFVAGGLHLLVPAERLRPPQIVGLVCAFAGVVVAFADGFRNTESREWIGDALMLVAAVLWGSTTIVVRASALARIDASKTLFYQLGTSAILLPLASWGMGEAGFISPSALGIVAFAGQVVFVAFASYLGWFWLVRRYPATRLAAFSFLTPLFGMAFGAALLHETITPQLVVAFVLVAAGLWLVNRRERVVI